MKRSLFLVLCVLMTTGLVRATEQSDDKRPADEELRAAHEALREAVETIRVYHEGEGGGTYTFHFGDDDESFVDSDRPRLGVVVEQDSEGARIVAVTPSGPAAEAGLETGDVITAVNGRSLTDSTESPSAVLVDAIRDLEEGDSATVDYLRQGERRTATVTVRPVEIDVRIVKVPGEPGRHITKKIEVVPGGHESVWFFPHGWMDMEMVALNPDLAEYFGTDEGVLVVRAPESEALGLKGGDVIVSMDNRVVKSPTHAIRILRSYEPEERLTIEIVRHGHRETIEASVPEAQADLMHGDIGHGYEYEWHEKGEE